LLQTPKKIIALKQGCYETTISPVFWSYYEELIDDCFGYWLGFWYGDESFTLEETKELFFLTLKKLLDDNKVVVLLQTPKKIIALKQGCYETTISPVFWSTQPICGH
jgi:hypothetical protein